VRVVDGVADGAALWWAPAPGLPDLYST